jgi:hypothetical protein
MDPEELLRQGVNLVREGDRKRGTALIAKAVKADSALIQGWWALANLLGDPEQKKQCIHQVLALNPDHSGARAMWEELQVSEEFEVASLVSKAPDKVSESVPSEFDAHAGVGHAQQKSEAVPTSDRNTRRW